MNTLNISKKISHYLSQAITHEDLQKWDKQHFWHPFTQMQEYVKQDNLIFVKGEGHYLFDSKGNKYLDSIASLWCNLHGHAHPRLNDIMIKQLSLLSHSTTLGASNPPAIILAKILAELTGLPHTFYSEDGAEAVEIALKMAFQYWQHLQKPEKKRFLCLDQAYHGDTLGAVSVGGFALFHQTFAPLLFETHKLHSPYYFAKHHFGNMEHQWNSTDATCGYMYYLEQILTKSHHEIAGIIIEGGIQCAAGFLPFPLNFMAQLKKLCTKFNILLIVDEVATGFGRTGKMFASIDLTQNHLSPDILVLGKSIAAGYLPLAVTQTSKKVYDAFLGNATQYKQFFHGHTFTGNALACRLAIESIALIDDEQLLQPKTFNSKENAIEKGLANFYKYGDYFNIKRKGLMLAIELTQLSTDNSIDNSINIMKNITSFAAMQGVYTRPLGYHLIVFPPLSISTLEIALILEVLWNAVNESGYLNLKFYPNMNSKSNNNNNNNNKADF